eukprot:CAMPEP_0119486464 /NCGR_PEP_ID=MMETSP1344-20130328/12851_1 /TAXON_ID=236787 /ORGANISM="Florenciella parvula, Strain CCMP2471" /LENGTH=376 /DNA_ID=CAMNT_0007521223 /DNA_START=14 /DNA_END=1144 /DNA_ORIENTATION=+
MPKGGYQAINSAADVEASTGINVAAAQEKGELLMRQGSVMAKKVESCFSSIHNWMSHHKKFVDAACALAMLFYGGKFAKCMLLYQTAKVTAGPTVSKGVTALYDKYVSARAEIAEQASTIVDAAGTLKQFTNDVKKLQKEMDTAQAKFKGGNMTKEQMEETMKTGKESIAEIMQEVEKLEASMSSVKAIMHAIDIPELKRVIMGMWAACMAVIATFASPAAENVTLGLSLGTQIHHYATAITYPTYQKFARKPMQPTVKKWVDSALLAASSAAGVYAASILAALTIIFSTCSVVAMTLLHMLADAINPWMYDKIHYKLDPESKTFITLHLVIAGTGTAAQILGLGIPGPINILLTPFNMLELYLVGLSSGVVPAPK